MTKRKTGFFAFLCLLCSCSLSESEKADKVIKAEPVQQAEVQERIGTYSRNGKRLDVLTMTEVYQKVSLDSLDIPIITTDLVYALEQQKIVLEKRRQKRKQQIGNLKIDLEQLAETIKILIAQQHTKPFNLEQSLDAYQLWGRDRKGNVQFTGYYTPIIKVNKRKTNRYPYPLYDRPRKWEGPWPTRAQIEGEGAFDSLDLELAYAKNKVDIYYMQVQGSGYVQYPNGRTQLYAYNGNNKHPYRSIEKYILSRDDIAISNLTNNGIKSYIWNHPEMADTILFSNPSYTFFTPKSSKPKGAGHVPLIEDISLAVDSRYIPLGSCLLAAIPVYDKEERRIVDHEFRFLLAQDVGGAIKGPGHVDLYQGIGEVAKGKAEALHHYGNLWLLLPKAPRAKFTSTQ